MWIKFLKRVATMDDGVFLKFGERIVFVMLVCMLGLNVIGAGFFFIYLLHLLYGCF